MIGGAATKPQGYAISTGPAGMVECDTITCCHCNAVVHIPPKADPNKTFDFCRQCMKATCAACGGKPCMPFMKRLEQMEARYHARRSYEI